MAPDMSAGLNSRSACTHAACTLAWSGRPSLLPLSLTGFAVHPNYMYMYTHLYIAILKFIGYGVYADLQLMFRALSNVIFHLLQDGCSWLRS